MKKVFFTLVVFLVILFSFNKGFETETIDDNSLYKQDYYVLKFDNLNSKKLNSLLEGISGTVVEVEVSTKHFVKSYRFNTVMISDIERELISKVIFDLESVNQRELASSYKVSGVNITRIDIICNKYEADLIKSRSEVG